MAVYALTAINRAVKHSKTLHLKGMRTIAKIYRKQSLFTIYTGKPVGLPFGSVWANGKQISVLGKFRSGLALTICRNPYHLPKNLHDGDG